MSVHASHFTVFTCDFNKLVDTQNDVIMLIYVIKLTFRTLLAPPGSGPLKLLYLHTIFANLECSKYVMHPIYICCHEKRNKLYLYLDVQGSQDHKYMNAGLVEGT